MRRTFVELPAHEVMRVYRERGGVVRLSPPEAEYGAKMRQYAERRFYELAGSCAVPAPRDGILWERDSYHDRFIAWCDIPSPEGLLL